MLRLTLVSLALLATSTPRARAQDFAGTFVSTDGGGTTTLTLMNATDGIFKGTVAGGGETAEVEGDVQDGLLAGTMSTPLGMLHFHAEFAGDLLQITLFQIDPSGEVIHDDREPVGFRRTRRVTPDQLLREDPVASPQPTSDGSAVLGPPPPGERHPTLVGRWIKEDTSVDSQMSFTTTEILDLRAEGTFEQRAGRMAGGTAGISIQGGEGTDAARGFWRTESSQFYMMAPGQQWVRCCRFYVEGDRLLITHQDGSREIWHRRD